MYRTSESMFVTSPRRCFSHDIPSVLHTTEIYFTPWYVWWFFIVIEMFATSKRWHFPHDKGCVFYTTETYRTHHMLENCAPHYLSIKSPQKSVFIYIIILLIIVQELDSLYSIFFKLLKYKHYWYAVSFIWWQHQRRKIKYFFHGTEIPKGLSV